MKVIKSGNANIYNDYSKECTCAKCNAILLIELNDVYRKSKNIDNYFNMLLNQNNDPLYFCCPECLKENCLDGFEFPLYYNIPFRTGETVTF